MTIFHQNDDTTEQRHMHVVMESLITDLVVMVVVGADCDYHERHPGCYYYYYYYYYYY